MQVPVLVAMGTDATTSHTRTCGGTHGKGTDIHTHEYRYLHRMCIHTSTRIAYLYNYMDIPGMLSLFSTPTLPFHLKQSMGVKG